MSYSDFHETAAAPRDMRCDTRSARWCVDHLWPAHFEGRPLKNVMSAPSAEVSGIYGYDFTPLWMGDVVSKSTATIRRQPKAQAIFCENRNAVEIIRQAPRSG